MVPIICLLSAFFKYQATTRIEMSCYLSSVQILEMLVDESPNFKKKRIGNYFTIASKVFLSNNGFPL